MSGLSVRFTSSAPWANMLSIGGGTIVTQDVLPFSLTLFEAREQGLRINKVGLTRRGFSPERLQLLQKAFRLLLASKMNTSQAVEKSASLRVTTRPCLPLSSSAAGAGSFASYEAWPHRRQRPLSFSAAGCGPRAGPCRIGCGHPRRDRPRDRRAAAGDEHISVHWPLVGELSRLIETFHKEGVSTAVMAGQVKHKQIFSSIRPDWRLAKLLLNLRTRNTDMAAGCGGQGIGRRRHRTDQLHRFS